MKEIPLTGKYGIGKFAIVDDEDFELVNSSKWYLSGEYPVRSFGARPNRTKISLHRFLMKTPANMVTDHINGNGLDNRKSNLRICTNAENIMNAKKSANKTSQYKGVCKLKPWRASIGRKTLGYFETEIEAARAYDAAAIEMYKEFARLNFPIT